MKTHDKLFAIACFASGVLVIAIAISKMALFHIGTGAGLLLIGCAYVREIKKSKTI